MEPEGIGAAPPIAALEAAAPVADGRSLPKTAARSDWLRCAIIPTPTPRSKSTATKRNVPRDERRGGAGVGAGAGASSVASAGTKRGSLAVGAGRG